MNILYWVKENKDNEESSVCMKIELNASCVLNTHKGDGALFSLYFLLLSCYWSIQI